MTLIADWLAREGVYLLSWWLLATAAGVAALPWCWRLLGGLPDKGYTLARPLGLMLVGFLYWLLGSIGLLQNEPGGIILAWLIVLGAGVWLYRRGERLPQGYWRETASVRMLSEVIFIGLFLGWAIFRAYQNDTSTTEKPMELAFMTGILRSSSFPPNDPWLSGYAISYYYFGYVMSAMFTMLSGVTAGIGFSLTIAMWFALTGVAAFGVAYNMVRSRAFRHGSLWDDSAPSNSTVSTVIAAILVAAFVLMLLLLVPIATLGLRVAIVGAVILLYRAVSGFQTSRVEMFWNDSGGRRGALGAGVIAVVCVLFLSNFQFPLIEIPYQSRSVPAEYFQFWRTQGRTDFTAYTQVNSSPFTITDPTDWEYWWFFRASRVLTDINLDGTLANGAQPIDEFPNFSFLLSDAHPHVLALPFVILCLGLALNIVLLPRNPTWPETFLYGLMVGCLIFLNTWDGPVYLMALVGAYMLRRIISKGGHITMRDWLGTLGYFVVLLVISVVSVLPFLIGFRSQAGGFLPNLIYPTYFPHFFLMFGPFMFLTGGFILVEAWRGNRTGRMNWKLGVGAAVGSLVFLGLLLVVFVILASLIPSLRDSVGGFVEANGGWDVVSARLLERRISYAATVLLLLLTIVVIVARLFPRSDRKLHDDETITEPYSPATGFALLLVGIAVVMTLIPEFVYLRDVFGTRINTIFKFYYQAWILLSIATAYGVWSVFTLRSEFSVNPVLKTAYAGVAAIVFFLGVLYAIFGTHYRMFINTGRVQESLASNPITLDGTPNMTSADDYAMVQCLANLIQGDDAVVVEAQRDAYSSHYNRVGSITGIPTVMGWRNHENQWRGPTFNETAGGRAESVDALYNASDIEFARQIIDQYEIDYIVYGRTERETYDQIGEEKFMESFPVVCEVGDNRVYRVVPPLPGSQG